MLGLDQGLGTLECLGGGELTSAPRGHRESHGADDGAEHGTERLAKVDAVESTLAVGGSCASTGTIVVLRRNGARCLALLFGGSCHANAGKGEERK